MVRRLFAGLARLLTIATLTRVFRRWADRVEQETAARVQAQDPRRPRPGWNRPKPEKTPKPTYWPFLLALGVMFLAWGLISNIFILGAGLLLFALSAMGWIGDFLNEA